MFYFYYSVCHNVFYLCIYIDSGSMLCLLAMARFCLVCCCLQCLRYTYMSVRWHTSEDSIPFLSSIFFLVWAFTCFALHLIPPASAHSTRNLNWGRFRRRNNKSGGGSGGGSGGSFFSFAGASASSGSDCKFSKFVHSQEHEPPFSFPFIQALMVSDKRIGRRMSCWWVKGFGPAKRKDPKQSKQAGQFQNSKALRVVAPPAPTALGLVPCLLCLLLSGHFQHENFFLSLSLSLSPCSFVCFFFPSILSLHQTL